MKSFLVIGMGRFGYHLSKKLAINCNDVMIADKTEENFKDLLNYVTSAQIGDCKNEEMLQSMDVSSFDMCFVCIGSDFQSSLEISSLLKEFGAKVVISKASTRIQEKFLLRNDADAVVYPEKDLAERLAFQYSAKNVFDYIQISDDVAMFEVAIPNDWIGKTIRQIDIRGKYKLNVLAIKSHGSVNPMPDADHQFEYGEHIMIMGRHTDVEKYTKRF